MNIESTAPKPFVFVLMPFDSNFSDIYKFGIKGAAEDVGAYAERVDEQIFNEGILDRIFNQISKSDVVVADMTGRNPNVFYEVGYAHALGKTTLLLTQNVNDIPFDLKHRQHIVYGGRIETLRKDLAEHLRWAIEASQRERTPLRSERLTLFIYGMQAVKPESVLDVPILQGEVTEKDFWLPVQLRNDSADALNPITHVYLLSKADASLVPLENQPTFTVFTSGHTPARTHLVSLSAGLLSKAGDFDAQFRLPLSFPSMPPGAVEVANVEFQFRSGKTESNDHFRLRLFSASGFHEFDFKLSLKQRPKDATEEMKSESIPKG